MRVRRRAARVAVPLTLLAVFALVTSCARGPAAGTSPLTGSRADTSAPVLAVKIDNARTARPWTGVEDADVVYVEPVEGGSTRLLAVFSSRRPASVGPVRSFRESDLALLASYGRPALAFSGAAPELAGALAAAPVVPLSPATASEAFRRDPARRPPDNLYADPAALLRAAGGATEPRDVGFEFGAAPAGGAATGKRRLSVGSTAVGVDWDPAGGRWLLSFDGRPAMSRDGDRLGAATVLVQSVATRSSSVRDAAGAVSPVAETVGTGAAEVLRDGRSWTGTWSRSAPDRGTRVVTDAGAPATFAPGPVWVLLDPAGE